jgi:hypothetical protein
MPLASLTDGTDRGIVALLLDRRDTFGVEPRPIAFRASTWRRWLPEHSMGALEVFDEERVSIGDLERLSAGGHSRRDRRLLFTAALIWGLGKKNARLLPGFVSALEHPGLDDTLAETFKLVRRGLSAEAYEVWLASRLPGLGEAFFTKWFFVAGLAGLPPGSPQPHVLDGNVWKSLRRLGWSSEHTTGIRQKVRPSAAYAAYNAALARWADELTSGGPVVSSLNVEQFLFCSNGFPDG